MKHSFFRPLVAILAATGALSVSVAHSAQVDVNFSEFYNTATLLNFTDTKVLDNPIASLKLLDVDGGVQGTLKFLTNSGLPSKTAGSLGVDALWLESADKGAVTTISGPSATSTYYKHGFYKQGEKFNYDIDYKTSFKEGSTSTFSIKGVTVDSFLTADGKGAKGIMLDVTGVGKPYTGFLGLNKNVRFIGEVVVLPEPSTYALMGLGLVGVFGAASRRKRA